MSTVSVLLGNGAGGFGAKTDFATGETPASVAIGDLSGDGKPDLVVANYGANTVSVLLGLVKTRTTVSPTPNVAVLGSPVSWTARVSIAGSSSATLDDSVRFFDGTTEVGTAFVFSGVATLALPALRLGERSITAEYLGNARLFRSYSPVEEQIVLAAASVDVGDAAPLAFALEGVRPNPTTSGRLAVAFTLPVDAPVRLELVDVKGRRIAVRDLDAPGAGPHVVDLAGERKIRAGLYFVRLTQGSLERSVRVVVLN